MTAKQNVKATILFQNPQWLPILYFNEGKEKSDILILDYLPPSGFQPGPEGENEWGVVWEALDDGTMGQPKRCPLRDGWELLDSLPLPNPYAEGRFEDCRSHAQKNSDKFLMGGLHLSGFAILTSLRGFEEAMADLVLEPERVYDLMNRIADFEIGLMRGYQKLGADAIAFYDDWGSQKGLLIRPQTWREIFKPIYKRQFEAAHALGLLVYFHCCGDIRDILPDLIEIGADVLNLNQPDVLGLDYLAQFRGKVCFNCPVDHQTVAINGSGEEISAYVQSLSSALATPEGGFIGYIEEYSSVGMSRENYRSICDAFENARGTAYASI